VPAWCNTSPQVDMSLHSGTLFWFRANQSLLFLLNVACLIFFIFYTVNVDLFHISSIWGVERHVYLRTGVASSWHDKNPTQCVGQVKSRPHHHLIKNWMWIYFILVVYGYSSSRIYGGGARWSNRKSRDQKWRQSRDRKWQEVVSNRACSGNFQSCDWRHFRWKGLTKADTV
jgi:hypothetical protein